MYNMYNMYNMCDLYTMYNTYNMYNVYIYLCMYMTDFKKPLCKKCSRSDTLIYGHAFLPARRKDTGRIPEGYRKGNRHLLSDPLTDPFKGPLTDPLTDP